MRDMFTGFTFILHLSREAFTGAKDILDSTLRDVRECPEGECVALALSTV